MVINPIMLINRYSRELISDKSHINKIIGMNTIPPVLGLDTLCNDLLFGVSCIFGSNLKCRMDQIETNVNVNEKNNTQNELRLLTIIYLF